jgi:probable rRNA maturation factor
VWEIDIVVDHASMVSSVDVREIERHVQAALDALSLASGELSVVLTTDDHIQVLNRTWRGKDQPTDVLSFPQQVGDVTGGILGDLVISLDTAARQATRRGHALHMEVCVLLTHGLCHLLGHTHQDLDDTRVMRALETHVLDAMNVGQDTLGLVERVLDGR